MIKKLSIICIFVGTLTASEHDKKLKPVQLHTIEGFYKKEISPLQLATQRGKIQQVRILLRHSAITEQEIQAAKEISRTNHNRAITNHLLQKLERVLLLEHTKKDLP